MAFSGVNGSGDDSMSIKSLTYVIIPLICVLVIALVVVVLYYRRRRRLRVQYRDWPQQYISPDGHRMVDRRGRWNVWRGMTSTEGLNELGEAPPAYNTQKNTDTDMELANLPEATPTSPQAAHLRDMESGAMPPGYVAEHAATAQHAPPPAHDTTASAAPVTSATGDSTTTRQ